MIDRREFLAGGALSAAFAAAGGDRRDRSGAAAGAVEEGRRSDRRAPEAGDAAEGDADRRSPARIFLCGDVMTGRGVDQIFPSSVDPRLYEPYVRDARDYVELAERANGEIPRNVDAAYVWGDLLDELDRADPHVRIVNLETAVTTSDDPWEGKGIHYRMHPDNVACLTAARIDCCVLSNNHVLDWGVAGLEETLGVLEQAGVRPAGAGRSPEAARAPAALEVEGGGRVLVFGFGVPTSGIPREWRAGGGPTGRVGIELLEELSGSTLAGIASRVREVKEPGDLAVASIHWGGNWGYRIPDEQREFARGLIDEAGIDVVHGHSSHHAKGIEVHRERPILYGCGDFLNDYEGIRGHESYRGDLPLAYLPTLDPGDGDPLDPGSGGLVSFEMIPLRIRRFRLQRASEEEARWLAETLGREGDELGTGVEIVGNDRLALRWRQ